MKNKNYKAKRQAEIKVYQEQSKKLKEIIIELRKHGKNMDLDKWTRRGYNETARKLSREYKNMKEEIKLTKESIVKMKGILY